MDLAPPEILVISTLSTGSHNATRRAALVARERGWTLRVLHVQRDPRRVPAAQAALQELCDQLQARLGIAVAVDVASGGLLKHVLPRARACSLLVVGSARENALKEEIAGVGMERLLRACRVPTLIVKRQVDAAFAQAPAHVRNGGGGWSRVLVCVQLDPAAAAMVTAARGVAPGARLEAFHAVEPGALDVRPAGEGMTDNPTVLGSARSALTRLLAPAAGQACVPSVGFGLADEALLARQRAIGAELVVVGRRHRGLLAGFFLGRVTRQVVASSTADVLLLQPAVEAAARIAERDGGNSEAPHHSLR